MPKAKTRQETPAQDVPPPDPKTTQVFIIEPSGEDPQLYVGYKYADVSGTWHGDVLGVPGAIREEFMARLPAVIRARQSVPPPDGPAVVVVSAEVFAQMVDQVPDVRVSDWGEPRALWRDFNGNMTSYTPTLVRCPRD